MGFISSKHFSVCCIATNLFVDIPGFFLRQGPPRRFPPCAVEDAHAGFRLCVYTGHISSVSRASRTAGTRAKQTSRSAAVVLLRGKGPRRGQKHTPKSSCQPPRGTTSTHTERSGMEPGVPALRELPRLHTSVAQTQPCTGDNTSVKKFIPSSTLPFFPGQGQFLAQM